MPRNPRKRRNSGHPHSGNAPPLDDGCPVATEACRESSGATGCGDDVLDDHGANVTTGHIPVSTGNVPCVHPPAPDGWHNDDCMPPDTATRLRLLRRERNIRQDDVAAAVDVDRSMISKIEKGKPFGRELLVKLAEFYGVSIQWLVNGQGERDILAVGDLTPMERDLLQAFRDLPDAEARAALTMILAASKR